MSEIHIQIEYIKTICSRRTLLFVGYMCGLGANIRGYDTKEKIINLLLGHYTYIEILESISLPYANKYLICPGWSQASKLSRKNKCIKHTYKYNTTFKECTACGEHLIPIQTLPSDTAPILVCHLCQKYLGIKDTSKVNRYYNGHKNILYNPQFEKNKSVIEYWEGVNNIIAEISNTQDARLNRCLNILENIESQLYNESTIEQLINNYYQAIIAFSIFCYYYLEKPFQYGDAHPQYTISVNKNIENIYFTMPVYIIFIQKKITENQKINQKYDLNKFVNDMYDMIYIIHKLPPNGAQQLIKTWEKYLEKCN